MSVYKKRYFISKAVEKIGQMMLMKFDFVMISLHRSRILEKKNKKSWVNFINVILEMKIL